MGVELILSDECRVVLGSATIDVDKTKMTQVMRNLLSNALKFTPAGGTVRVEAQYADRILSSGDNTHSTRSETGANAAPTFLRIRVVDTGAGISQVCSIALTLT